LLFAVLAKGKLGWHLKENFMRPPLALVFALCGLAMAATPAPARNCPVSGGNERQKFISEAPSCEEAVRRFKLCAIGATLDGPLSARVGEVCEKAYLSKLPENERKAYAAAIYACNAPYVAKRATIYRSVSAHCRVDAMAQYAKGH
jgi:hypothetical protein